jgi:hypothetical protein
VFSNWQLVDISVGFFCALDHRTTAPLHHAHRTFAFLRWLARLRGYWWTRDPTLCSAIHTSNINDRDLNHWSLVVCPPVVTPPDEPTNPHCAGVPEAHIACMHVCSSAKRIAYTNENFHHPLLCSNIPLPIKYPPTKLLEVILYINRDHQRAQAIHNDSRCKTINIVLLRVMRRWLHPGVLDERR